MYYVKIDANFN